MDFIADQIRLPRKDEAAHPAECLTCEGGGHVLSAYQASGAPNFEECPVCGNPEGLPSP